MKLIKPPAPITLTSTWQIFLAGSIEMGKAVDWQSKVAGALAHIDDVIVYNPRRDDWDSSWVQSIENEKFRGQVEWELKALESSDLIVIHFQADTMSPITLLELGLFARDEESRHRLIVHCPAGFWRKGNVDVVCKRYDVKQVPTLDDLVAETIRVTKDHA